MKKLMWKVIILETGEIVIFEKKSTAQAYVSYLKECCNPACLNQWQWETTAPTAQIN